VPRQNRVTPLGEIIAASERGTFMGNRGCLHDAAGRIRCRNVGLPTGRQAWQLKRWIVCLLKFKGRKRQVMTPGHYTELFFLDEATALAAGHRPCAECRRERFNAFRQAIAASSTGNKPLCSAVEIDSQLHAERLAPDGSKRLYTAKLDKLPDGAFVLVPNDVVPHLVWGDGLLAWSIAGYTNRIERPGGMTVEVLTPELTICALRGGYAPELHPSALALLNRL
jgi:hypothetical protein